MKTIPVSGGRIMLVDDEDASIFDGKSLSGQRVGRHVYAAFRDEHGAVRMAHRVILGLPLGSDSEVDHANLNTLDNRRSNLRLCTRQQNAANRGRFKNNTSGFKGVSNASKSKKCALRKPWMAQIKVNGKSRYLGMFATPDAAHAAYIAAAREHFGEFARAR